MAIKGVDYTDRRMPIASLKANGVQFVSRYLSQHVGNDWKDLHPSEAKALSDAGIRVISNWETVIDPTNTVSNGEDCARAAYSEARECGMPDWAPIYFSIDSDVPVASHDSYFRGVCNVLGVDRVGVYGSYGLCSHLKAAGLVTYTWRSMSTGWRGGAGPAGMTCLQTGGGHIAGISVDWDVARVDDYGGWFVGEEKDMAITAADAKMIAAAVWAADVIPVDPKNADPEKQNWRADNSVATLINRRLPAIPTAAEVAAAVVAALPPAQTGGLTEDDVKSAVLAVMKSLTFAQTI